MGRHYHYRPGSFYRTDDRTGFPQYAENTRQEWNGLIVDEAVWEARQPQDLVRGVKDVQSVQGPRPLPAPTFDGPIYVTVAANVGPGANAIASDDASQCDDGDVIGIMLDSGVVFRATITSIVGTTINFTGTLPGPVSAGNLVADYKGAD